MKKTIAAILILTLLCLTGCSIPAKANYTQLSSFTREEKKVKGAFGNKSTIELIKDFRENEMYPEDITDLKERVEKYIGAHAGLNEATKNNLRELKVTRGATKEEVNLLLGDADKIGANGNLWIYRISKMRAFTFFIFPVFIAHEGYYLRFQDNRLAAIERHYPEQVLHQASGPGLSQQTSGPE